VLEAVTEGGKPQGPNGAAVGGATDVSNHCTLFKPKAAAAWGPLNAIRRQYFLQPCRSLKGRSSQRP
jgi:hypothetical protein